MRAWRQTGRLDGVVIQASAKVWIFGILSVDCKGTCLSDRFQGWELCFVDVLICKDAGDSDLGFKESRASEVKSVVRAFCF